ncbi:MAG: hypothetical protein ACAI44_03870 [Candidatus Sericytochromatia bacterium]
MTTAVTSSPNFIQKIFGSSTSTTTPTAAAPTATPTYSADQVQVASTNTDPNTQTAGFWKKTGDVFGEMFSDMAYSMNMGETYDLVRREFQQCDFNLDGQLNMGEFTVATMNPFEFQVADKNYDGRLSLNEFANYRKERLEISFKQKDVNGDRHLNVAEIGSVGRMYLANRDPRLDRNMDGLANKREYVRAQLTLGISIRDMFGF